MDRPPELLERGLEIPSVVADVEFGQPDVSARAVYELRDELVCVRWPFEPSLCSLDFLQAAGCVPAWRSSVGCTGCWDPGRGERGSVWARLARGVDGGAGGSER